MSYYVYILQSFKDKNFYTGYTNDLERRLVQHNQSKSFPMQFRKPFKLIYYEMCLSKDDAVAREKYLKSGMGKRFIKNRLKNYMSNNF
jgi:putative endonuclease